MNIFKEASANKAKGIGYMARRFKAIWQSKKCSWQHIRFERGIRWSDQWQIFPIRNTSHNCQRSIMFGIWKLYFEVIYYRSGHFNQDRKLFLRKPLWKFYQLLF